MPISLPGEESNLRTPCAVDSFCYRTYAHSRRSLSLFNRWTEGRLQQLHVAKTVSGECGQVSVSVTVESQTSDRRPACHRQTLGVVAVRS
jgi:hypothetical protein